VVTAAKHLTQILLCEAILEYELDQVNSEPISEKPGRINGTVLPIVLWLFMYVVRFSLCSTFHMHWWQLCVQNCAV
jgi:hypothetical protein